MNALYDTKSFFSSNELNQKAAGQHRSIDGEGEGVKHDESRCDSGECLSVDNSHILACSQKRKRLYQTAEQQLAQ